MIRETAPGSLIDPRGKIAGGSRSGGGTVRLDSLTCVGNPAHLDRKARLGFAQAGLVAVVDHRKLVAKPANARHDVGKDAALRCAEPRSDRGLFVYPLINGQ